MQQSEHYNMNLPEGPDYYNVEDFNSNTRVIDEKMYEFETHTQNTNNPHGVTKTQLGLENVENKSSAMIRGELTSADVENALGYTAMNIDGSNAASEVTFSGAFTVGNRLSNSTIGGNSVVEGNGNVASGDYSHAEGNGTTASGGASHTEGNYGLSRGIGSHSEGWSDTLTINIGNRSSSAPTALDTTVNPISAIGAGSHAEGYVKKSGRSGIYENIIGAIQASGDGAHAEGYSESTNAIYGYTIIASGKGSHAEGYAKDYDIIASGSGSHAEGTGTQATGPYSHAEGYRTIASASYAHAEGSQCKAASSEGGHAEGKGTEAGYWSHSEGVNTRAYGFYSHTEGSGTYVSGDYGHAEGRDSKAYGDGSHAGGLGGIAHRDGQFVQGGGYEGNKFPNNTFSAYGQGKAYFGFQPSLTETRGDITDGTCGCGGTLIGTDDIETARISLEPLGMYVLYCSAFESDGVVYGECVYMITASGNYWQVGYQNFTSDPPTILPINQTSNDVAQINAVAHNVVSIHGTRAYTQFHLIRIM